MEGLNHRRNTEKEEITQTQSVAPNTSEEGMSSAITQSTKTSDIHNDLSINKWKPKRMKQRKMQI